MSGRNQHHIPQFFQRGFGVKAKGKPREIWVYRPGEQAELGRIADIAADWDFYSSPSADGSETLDDKITRLENPLAIVVKSVRDQEVGSVVDGTLASNIVIQLAPRSGHFRTSFTSGMNRLMETASEIFTDPEQLERLFGLDKDQPTETFRSHLRKLLSKHPEIEMVGLPSHVLERAAFYVARESFDATIADTMPMFGALFAQFQDGSADLVREGHNRALDSWTDGPNPRREQLAALNWAVEAAPPEGAVLPDCVALARQSGEPVLPLMFVGKDFDAVVMPLSTSKLLIGQRDSAPPFDISTFNREATACSHEFFLAAVQSELFENLAEETGVRTESFFDSATEDAIGGYLPPPAPTSDVPPAEPSATAELPAPVTDFSYQISCLRCGDEAFAQNVASVVNAIVKVWSPRIPLARLDGITFAADYPTALRELDRGDPEWPPVETVSADVGIGVARMVMVARDGQIKGRIVMNGFIAQLLVGEDEKDFRWAAHVLSQQIVLVAMLQWIEEALPGRLRSSIANDFQSMLYREVDAALHAYVAAQFTGAFGDEIAVADGYRDLLVQSLNGMKDQIEAKRLSYRHDGDLDGLLGVAMPAIGHVLHFAAQYLGHCSTTDGPIIDGHTDLVAALQRAGLVHWLPDFGRDLQRFSQRLGRWESFDEFLAFNRHVERLLWAVGMFPWEGPDGNRVEIPLISDAPALMAEAQSTP